MGVSVSAACHLYLHVAACVAGVGGLHVFHAGSSFTAASCCCGLTMTLTIAVLLPHFAICFRAVRLCVPGYCG
jgi:hypothetical protein